MNEMNENLNILELFKEQTRLLLHDKETFKAEFLALPKAPDLKSGDRIKVLNVHALSPTEDMTEKEKTTVQGLQEIFDYITSNFTQSPHSLIAAMIVFKDLMGTDNQFIFVDALNTQGVPVISAIELDLPLSQAIVDCTGPEDGLGIGDEVSVVEMTTLENFDEEYQLLSDLSKLVYLLAEKFGFEPDEQGELSQEQVNEILSLAETLGFIEIAPKE